MAYNLATDKMREIIYSGGAVYNCRLYFNDRIIPAEQITQIKISSPIIDNSVATGVMFHLGTFISQQLTIKFRNLNGLDLTSNPDIYLEIGIEVDGEFVYIPIGHYLIDELSENYQTSCEITCLDYAVKFKSNVDISVFLNEEGYVYASDLFKALCDHFGVGVGTFPKVNNDKKIYFYDSSLTGKNYISYLAELFGGNAKIGRDGNCYIFPLKSEDSPIEINVLTGKSFEVGDDYEISRVCFDTGKQKFEAGGNVISVQDLPTESIDETAYYYLTSEMKYYTYVNEGWTEATNLKNTLYIRQDNLFITQQEDIDGIYNAVKGFKIANIVCQHRGDITLDSWDMLKYTTDDKECYTLNNNEMTFNGVCMSKVNTNIPTGNKEETTNIISPTTPSAIKRVQTIVNEVEGSLETIVTKTTEIENKTQANTTAINNNYTDIINKLGDYATEKSVIAIEESVKTAQTNSEYAIEVSQKIKTDGVERITTTTGYTFDEDGLTIEKTGAETKSTLDEAGLEITDTTGSKEQQLLFAGYDKESGETIVKSKNMTVEKYLVVGANSRMEDFVDENGRNGTGMFWIGG